MSTDRDKDEVGNIKKLAMAQDQHQSSMGSEELDLRQRCAAWSPDQWEEYLSELEIERQESLMPSWYIETVPNEDHIFDLYCADKEEQVVDLPEMIPISVRRAIMELTPRQAQVLIEIYWNNLSEGQTAKRLCISKNSVKTHKRWALKHLRATLPKELIEKWQKNKKAGERN